MKISKLALMGLMLSGSACNAVRESSRTHLTEQQSKTVLGGSVNDAARRLTELFSKRGFPLTDRQVRKGGSTLYLFKGPRSTTVSVTSGLYGPTHTVGSTFFALLTPQAGDTTQVELLGKPSLNDRTACTDQDPAWATPCEDVYAGAQWRMMTGREEADTIRGLLLELELANPRAQAAEPEKPSEPTKPACVASELPEWKTATALEKKRLLEQCRAPNPRE